MKRLSIIAAVFAVLAMAGVSFAANTATINVTSEPIAQGSSCGKAGGFTMTFDEGTIFTVGDKITFDLDLNTTLCKDISIEIGTWASGSLSGIGSATDLTDPDGAVVESTSGVVVTAGGDLTFQIIGTSGTQRVTLTVIGDTGATLEVLDDDDSTTTNFMKVSFLNGKDFSTYSVGDVVIAEYTAATTTDPAEWDLTDESSNTLCIDVSQTTATTVNANFDSANDTYTFIPSNPQVSHIAGTEDYGVFAPKYMEPGNIYLPGTGEQTECLEIDNSVDVSYNYEGGFCYTGDRHQNNDFILYSGSEFSFEGTIKVTLEILVNGESGENGVYWSGYSYHTYAYETTSDAADDNNVQKTGTITADIYASDGETSKDVVSDPSDCEVPDDEKALVLIGTQTAANLGIDADNKALLIDIPNMAYDTSVVEADDVVSVKVTVENLPCGMILDGETMEIGTFGCVAAGSGSALRYPYFGNASGAYANAIVITNLDDADGTATLTMYESDGDIATATVDLTPHGMVVNLVNNLDWTVTDSSGSGAIGDARSYIDLSATVNVDGTAMITNASTGESISYLPRQEGDM